MHVYGQLDRALSAPSVELVPMHREVIASQLQGLKDVRLEQKPKAAVPVLTEPVDSPRLSSDWPTLRFTSVYRRRENL